jgi:hypothetical protein
MRRPPHLLLASVRQIGQGDPPRLASPRDAPGRRPVGLNGRPRASQAQRGGRTKDRRPMIGLGPIGRVTLVARHADALHGTVELADELGPTGESRRRRPGGLRSQHRLDLGRETPGLTVGQEPGGDHAEGVQIVGGAKGLAGSSLRRPVGHRRVGGRRVGRARSRWSQTDLILADDVERGRLDCSVSLAARMQDVDGQGRGPHERHRPLERHHLAGGEHTLQREPVAVSPFHRHLARSTPVDLDRHLDGVAARIATHSRPLSRGSVPCRLERAIPRPLLCPFSR